MQIKKTLSKFNCLNYFILFCVFVDSCEINLFDHGTFIPRIILTSYQTSVSQSSIVRLRHSYQCKNFMGNVMFVRGGK